LALYGWGVPNEALARDSGSDLLTMVIQDAMAPLKAEKSKLITNNLQYYELPWPKDILAGLGKVDVELRVTLSYFIEPDIRSASVENFSRYPSHRFAFEMKGPDDDDVDAVRRGNLALDHVRRGKPAKLSEAGWSLGSTLRERGSIHHDRWKGQARDLARQNGVSIYPKGGWWADKKDPVYADLPARFSLIMSIHTPTISQDIYDLAVKDHVRLKKTRNAALVHLATANQIVLKK
jgi:hypothetical protein